jgi:AcrR family transcriptional regulator
LPGDGLRERKKARTRAAIHTAALALFRDQGYDATTVQQIAAAAEVSESTFFRYFQTKLDVLLLDEFDPIAILEFARQPPELSPVAAVRGAVRDAFGHFSPAQLDEQLQKTRLLVAIPELRATMLDQMAEAIDLIAGQVAERAGRGPGDVAVRALAGAVVGAMVAVALAVVDEPAPDLPARIDQALAELEAGFAL